MDELQAVRELLSERPPPRPEITAAARARLAGRTPRRPAPRRPPGRHRILWAALPAAAAATAAVVIATVVAAGGSTPHPAGSLGVYQPGAAAPTRAGGPARDILLAVARTAGQAAAATPPPATRYWVTSSVVGNFIRVGPAADRYVILEKTAVQFWAAANPRTMSQAYNQRLGVQLASAADRRAWRRDGSPASWDVGQETGPADPVGYTAGGGARVRAGLGKPQAYFGQSGGPLFVIGHRSYTARGLRGLPAGPARLKALLLTGYSPAAGFGGVDQYLFMTVPDVLTMPVAPGVRAGLYDLLAGLPGVRDLGRVRDAAGQPGMAVALSSQQTHCGHWTTVDSGAGHWTFPSCQVQQRLVIDPGTGRLLAMELRYLRLPPGQSWSAPGGLLSFQIFSPGRWTGASLPRG